MKILFLAAAFSIISTASFSQGFLDKAKSLASSHNISTSSLPSLGNIGGVKDAIMSKLTPSLSLTTAQKPAVSSTVTDYLKNKSTIMPLADTNKPAYTSKSKSLISGLTSKLKTVLTTAQYSKFLGLKPKTPSAGNALSSLFC